MSKKKFIIFTCIVVLITLIVLGIRLADHLLPGNDVTEYNTRATEKAWLMGSTRSNEILILKSLSRSDGDTTAEFNIYAIPSGSIATNFLSLQVSDIPSDSPLELMGTASCVFKNDDPTNIVGLTTRYMR